MTEKRLPLPEQPLPCPFCGGGHVVFTRICDDYEYVMCNGCGAAATSADTLPEHTPQEVWNMRSNVK